MPPPARGGQPPAIASTSATVRALDRYLERAVAEGASDLHLEPHGAGLRVRIRVDGRLRALDPPPPSMTEQLLTRARLLARVDLSERRLPQDGRFALDTCGERVDVRAAFVPVHGGEKVTLRLLGRRSRPPALSDLGLPAADRRVIEGELEHADGLLVVVGPTGSGKTTTLYAALNYLARPDVCAVTVEDPVERDLPDVAQIAVDEDCGRTFAAALRAILRHDPDIIMVGEMRDTRSASIACRAALTGHRVLTTLHTADTREALVRLADMGVADYLVHATVRLVLGQRLLRCACDACHRRRCPSAAEKAVFIRCGLEVPDAVAEPIGCERCGGAGYRGRRAVFEVLDRRGAGSGSTPRRSLMAAGLTAAAACETSVAEVLAVCPQPS
ncbi:MAG: GspE/PulE family protein [Candidatus Binatia bacterium]